MVSETAERITQAGIAASAAVLHPAGTVLLSRTASIGFSAVMEVPMAVSQDFMTWTPGPKLRSRFLLYVLRGMRDEFRRLMAGSTHKTIYMPDLLALRGPLPPIEAQESIVDFLDQEGERLSRLGSHLQEAHLLAREALGSRVEESIWQTDSARVPLVNLTDRARPIVYGILMPGPHVPDGVPVIHGGHVESGRLDRYELPCTTLRLHREYSRSHVRPGDLVMSVRGSYGAVAIVPPSVGEANVSRDAARISPAAGVSGEWLRLALIAPSARAGLEQTVMGTGVKGINIGAIRRLRVPLKPYAEQKSEVRQLAHEEARLKELTACMEHMLKRLVEYRDAVIAEAVTGRLGLDALSESYLRESAHAALEGQVLA